jgi:hypothetical protein
MKNDITIGADMRYYNNRRDLKTALKDAVAGEQALFVHVWGLPIGPACFSGAREIGKLFDQDARRLKETAHTLGVRKVKIDRLGMPEQHVDLVSTPLRMAVAQADPV